VPLQMLPESFIFIALVFAQTANLHEIGKHVFRVTSRMN
jgi:hypothetical protein